METMSKNNQASSISQRRSNHVIKVYNDAMIMASKRYDATVYRYEIPCVVRHRPSPIIRMM